MGLREEMQEQMNRQKMAQMQTESPSKPPAEIRPRRHVDYERAEEIVAAMLRYVTEWKPVPREWLEELTEINDRLSFKNESLTVGNFNEAFVHGVGAVEEDFRKKFTEGKL